MQFRVFPRLMGSVLKVPLAQAAIAEKLVSQDVRYGKDHEKALRAAKYYCATREIATTFIGKNVDIGLFANARVIRRGHIVQDRIRPLSDILYGPAADLSQEAVSQICLNVVQMNYELWNSGVAEITFGLDKYGKSSQGNLVLYDPFEMTDSLEDLKFLVFQKWWLVCNQHWPEEVQEVITEVFSTAFTEELVIKNFNKTLEKVPRKESLITPIRKYIVENNLS